MKITKEQIYKMNKASNRKIAIEERLPHFSHKVHKDKKKDYNRQANKRISFD